MIVARLTVPALEDELVLQAMQATEAGLLSEEEVVSMLADDVVRRSTLEVLYDGSENAN